MKVRVLFFGATADSVGDREISIDLPDGADANAARNAVYERFPSLAERHDLKSLHFSVNQEYARGSETIKEGDELAVFTAVSGG